MKISEIQLPWEPKTFIFRGYNPYIGGVNPSNFMVLGSHGKASSLEESRGPPQTLPNPRLITKKRRPKAASLKLNSRPRSTSEFVDFGDPVGVVLEDGGLIFQQCLEKNRRSQAKMQVLGAGIFKLGRKQMKIGGRIPMQVHVQSSSCVCLHGFMLLIGEH